MKSQQKLDGQKMFIKFNELRQAYGVKREFSPAELEKLLTDNGFNATIVGKLKKIEGLFEIKHLGTSKWFSFTNRPLNYVDMTHVLSEFRKESKKAKSSTVKPASDDMIAQAIKLLKNAGYKIQKPSGINLEAFKKDNPQMYEKYLVLEDV